MEINNKIKNILTIEINNLVNIKNINELNEFQAKNKYLFMAISQQIQVELGRIISFYDKNNFEEILITYKYKILELEKEESEKGKIINSLHHIFGYFKNDLSKDEKNNFLSEKNINNLLKTLKDYAKKFDNKYILKQSILTIN